MHKSHKSQVIRKKEDLSKILKQRLPRRVFNVIRTIGNLAEDNGFAAYIVGGVVRDILLGEKNLDVDVVVEGDTFKLIKLLEQKVDISVQRHQKFGTATITLPGGVKIDMATARKEYYAYPAALPQVSFSSMKDDLFRRDFTINALAIKINKHNFGELLDLFGGQKDLAGGKIKVLHKMSFIDDPTRILRAVRFEQRFNFPIEQFTARLIKNALKKKILNRLSRFRIGDEIILILKEEYPLRSLLRLSRLCNNLNFIDG